MQPDGIRIESIDTFEGFRAHRDLQNLIWAHDPPEAVPMELLIALARHGGVVLGAYAGTAMVGLLLSVLALDGGRLVHHSHMLGTHPGWRGHGIGEAMKWRQRELVLAQGIDTITWTFDPLEAVNARLNLSRLGGIVRQYGRDYYGAMEDALNRGVPSDRMIVEWSLDAPRVRERAQGQRSEPPADAAVALAAEEPARGLPRPRAFVAPTAGDALVEIPLRAQEIKRRDFDLALRWRFAVREALESLFAAGYSATGVARRDDRAFYYLERIAHED